MLKLVGVKKRFGPQRVLQGVDLEIPSGKLTTIIGPSAAMTVFGGSGGCGARYIDSAMAARCSRMDALVSERVRCGAILGSRRTIDALLPSTASDSRFCWQ